MTFNANDLLSTTFTEANSTETTPVPEGEFLAIAEKCDIVEWKAREDPTKRGLKLQITWNIDDADVKREVGRDKVTCRQELMLDLTESGLLDMGKGMNVGLGRLREALYLNDCAFAFPMIVGRTAKVKVTQRIYEDKIFSEIKAVARP